jgi:hypothetical protein
MKVNMFLNVGSYKYNDIIIIFLYLLSIMIIFDWKK